MCKTCKIKHCEVLSIATTFTTKQVIEYKIFQIKLSYHPLVWSIPSAMKSAGNDFSNSFLFSNG